MLIAALFQELCIQSRITRVELCGDGVSKPDRTKPKVRLARTKVNSTEKPRREGCKTSRRGNSSLRKLAGASGKRAFATSRLSCIDAKARTIRCSDPRIEL